ncbi:MAG: hypothetical protein ACLGSD_08555 [Acidobacteriota bacterium]
MNARPQPTHTQPGGFQAPSDGADNGVTNDALGTVSDADSTGLDEDKETGDAKVLNFDTHED